MAEKNASDEEVVIIDCSATVKEDFKPLDNNENSKRRRTLREVSFTLILSQIPLIYIHTFTYSRTYTI